MNKLVFGNLVHRPLRSLISVLAVAIEVIMILSIAAIMLGILNGGKTRTSGIGMDMFVRPATTGNLIGVTGAAAPIKVADILRKIPHVAVASPVNIQLKMDNAVENIYGIDYATYNALRPFVYLSGGPFERPYDVIIDDIFAATKNYKVGDTIPVLKHDFRICGIVEHGKGGRKLIPITTMGELTDTVGKASVFYLKLDDVSNEAVVRASILATPGMEQYDVQTLQEWLSVMTPDHIPGFNTALYVVSGIAVLVGFLVIFQSMYTAVMERTREIGILKSMGASRLYIVNVVLRESLMLTAAGIALGVASSYAMRSIFHASLPTLDFDITPGWVLRGVLVAFVGSLLGAFYPAWKAASKDPIDALAYE